MEDDHADRWNSQLNVNILSVIVYLYQLNVLSCFSYLHMYLLILYITIVLIYYVLWEIY